MRHFFNKSQSKRRFGHLSVVFGITLGILAFSACDDNETDDKLGPVSDANINANVLTKAEYGRLEFPRLKDSDENIVVTYKAEEKYGINFCVEWDKKRKTQRWSCYQIYPQNSEINTTRYYSDDEQYPYDKYNDNKEVLPYILMPDPYKGSGFQHGHIVPSQDRLYSEKANIQTFYMTNMQPQYGISTPESGSIWKIKSAPGTATVSGTRSTSAKAGQSIKAIKFSRLPTKVSSYRSISLWRCCQKTATLSIADTRP